jgi:hypothetical protein
VYCLWGVAVNVPTVWREAFTQLQTGVPPVRLGADAFHDAFFVVHASHAWGDWGGGFLFWHSSYFSICVWIALVLMQAPRLPPAEAR